MAEVVIERLSKEFAAVRAVDDVSLHVLDGEFLVLLGPSGCGKTTTLEIVAGLQRQTSGHVRIEGRLVDNVPAKDRDVAMVFQSYALYPHMTVFDNMAFPLKLRRRPKEQISAAVEQAAVMLGLEGLLDRKPKELSGGQMQRAALGRAIVRHPKVFLMDEPLSNLDAKLRVQTRAELKRLQRSLGTTTLYVTHDQVEAMTLGDRVAVLNRGKLQQLGTPEEIYTRPANVFVAGFIGSPPMNFLPCRYGREEHRAFLDLGEFRIELPKETAGRLEHRSFPKDLTLGLRPKHVSVHPSKVSGAVQAVVQLVQPLGSEVIATLQVGRLTLIAEAFAGWLVERGFNTTVGESVWISVEADKLNLFDARTEEALL